MTWFERWRGLTWDAPGNLGWLFFLLAAGVIAYAVFVYRKNDAPLGRRDRVLLASLRAGALLVLVAILARPVLSLAVPGGAARGVLVLLDRSQSMTLPGRSPEETREAELQRAREAVVEALGASYPLVQRPFDRGLGPEMEGDALPEPAGEVTDLAAALEQGLAEGGPRGRPGAVVLVTDGAQTAGADPLPLVRRSAVPVHAVALGSPKPVADLTLARVRANREAFVGEKTPVEAVIRLQGLDAAQVQVELLDVTEDSVRLAGASVTAEPQGAEQRVSLAFTPKETGLRFLEVRVSPLSGEATTLNNRRLIPLQVREEKTGVLFLSGQLTWDHTFIRRALDADSTLSVRSGAWKGGAFVSVTGQDLPAWSATALRDYRVIVLDHVAPTQLGSGLQAIAGFVRGGGGLLVISGGEAGDLGNWKGTPLEPLLPVQIAGVGPAGESQARLTPDGRRHVLFDPTVPGAPPLEAWTDLPPIFVSPELGPQKGASEALLVAGNDSEGRPVLATSHAGHGRVLMLSGAGIWRWDFSSASYRPSGNVLPGWWRRSVHWLARPDVETRIDIHPEDPVVARGRPVVFVARITDDAYQPVAKAEVDVEVRPIASSEEPRSLSLTGTEGFLGGAMEGLPPGRYRFEGRARSGSAALGTVEGTFVVDSLGKEMERLEADHEMLARLSDATGGTLWHPDSLSALGERFKITAEADEERVQVAIWDHPLLFALFVAFASTEWLVRRRRGLV